MMTTILVGGDVVPTQSNLESFLSGGSLWDQNLMALRDQADIAVFNLECPLTDSDDPIEKCGPCMKAPRNAVKGLCSFRPDAVSLANNHILDYGPEGIRQTMEALSANGILTFGAGSDLDEADRPLILERNGKKIGFYALAEHEFSYARENSPGANPLDLLNLQERIRQIRDACDFLVVLYHGGREHYRYPSPMLQKTCRKIAVSGADVVLCQHSHCIGSHETYLGKEILYGQGNFLFDAEDAGESFRTGLLVRIQIDGDGKSTVEYLPVRTKDGQCVLSEGEEREKTLGDLEVRSGRITDPQEVERLYQQYADEYREKMMKVFLNGNCFLKAVNILYGRKPSRVYDRNTKLAILNSMCCESLHELMSKVLE